MRTYRFYCLGTPCRVDSVRIGEFAHDDEAHAAAVDLLEGTGSYALEVWSTSTLVARIDRTSLPW
jgi:hypothetical protein